MLAGLVLDNAAARAHVRAVLRRPDIAPLANRIDIVFDADCRDGFAITPDGAVCLNPAALTDEATTASRLRHALELVLLRRLWPNEPVLAEAAAARVADRFRRMAGGREQSRPLSFDSPALADRLALLKPTEELLTDGGDVRLRVDPATGLNRYGCSPRPRPWAITFASSTASSISERGYAAAEELRRRLLAGANAEHETLTIKQRIRAHYGVSDAEVILTPSGTDATLVAMALVATEQPMLSVLMAPDETGSGVPLAAQGRHFDEVTALGRAASKGVVAAGFAEARLVAIALRDAAGLARHALDVDRDVARAVEFSIAAGQRPVLHVIDQSKTGLCAPSEHLLRALASRHGDTLAVIVDACQARCSGATIRRYLALDAIVLITGSKFFTGPPFAGAVLLPPKFATRLAERMTLPPGLGDYATRLDWPNVAAAAGLDSCPNFGLLLRWSAALAEMDAFASVPEAEAVTILQKFAAAVRGGLADSPDFEPIDVPELPQRPGWEGLQTIFPFRVLDPQRRTPMALDRLTQVYRWLNMDLSDLVPENRGLAQRCCHIGQPVPLGAAGVLRLAAGARLVSGEPSHSRLSREARIAREIADAEAVLDKISLILRHLDYLDAWDEAPDLARSAAIA
jgi:hypothetical protein